MRAFGMYNIWEWPRRVRVFEGAGRMLEGRSMNEFLMEYIMYTLA